MALAELAQHAREPGAGECPHQGDGDRVLLAARETPHRLGAVLQPGQRRLRVGQQGAAGLGQDHAAAHSLEERGAELLLQHLDAPADRGLGAVQALRRAGEAAAAGDRDEGFDLVDGHRDHYS